MTMTAERLAELDAVMVKATVAFPITSCDTEDYAEITFGSSQTQAMSMEPETLLAINDVFAAVPDLRAHIEAQAATIAGLREALTVIRAKDTRAEFFASTSGKTQRRVAGPYAKIARAALTGAA